MSQPPPPQPQPTPTLDADALRGSGRVRVWATTAASPLLREDVPVEEVSELLSDPGALVWVDLEAPSAAALATLQAECHLHPLAMEDVTRRHQRPKVDEYETFYFVVFYVPREGPDGELGVEEISLFLGDRFLVTIHAEPIVQIEESARRWRQSAQDIGSNIGALLYALLDSLVDAYFPLVDRIGDQVEEVQEAIFVRADRSTLQRLARLRRDLLHIRRVLAPEREVINTLLRRERPILPASSIVYFYDIYDHVVRLTDTIDTFRDLLGGAVDAYLSITSNNLNEVMKTLTGWSIILMSASLVAGIYGMNFQLMPELTWPVGYPLALALMLAIGGLLYIYFRRRNWL